MNGWEMAFIVGGCLYRSGRTQDLGADSGGRNHGSGVNKEDK